MVSGIISHCRHLRLNQHWIFMLVTAVLVFCCSFRFIKPSTAKTETIEGVIKVDAKDLRLTTWEKSVAQVQVPRSYNILKATLAETLGNQMKAVPVSEWGSPPLAPISYTQQTEIIPNNGEGSAAFGSAVAISGDTAVIGSVGDTVTSTAQGSAYIFVWNGTTWSQQAKLVSSDANYSSEFGTSVAISGDTVVVGAPQQDVGSHIHQGAAYVFTRTGTTWSQQAKLAASDGMGGDGYGRSVAVSGDTVLVGAFSHDTGPLLSQLDQGAAYIYTRNGTVWSENAELTVTGTKSFGLSVALENGTAVISAGYQYDITHAYGTAYVYAGSGANWSQQAQLTANGDATSSSFGRSVTINNNTVLVSAIGDNATVLSQGVAHVFVRTGTTWAKQATLVANDPKRADAFGASVSLEGDTAIIGTPGKTFNSNTNQGAAYVFLRTGTSWSQQGRLTASDGMLGDQFGNSVAIGNNRVLIGSSFHKIGSNGLAGVAYSFSNFVPCTLIGINPATLPESTFSTPYNQTLNGANGVGPYDFLVVEGSLPAGMTLSSDGVLTGTPTLKGVYNFTVVATDAQGCTGTRTYALTVIPACPSLAMNPLSLPAGITGVGYNQSFSITGGSGIPTYSLLDSFLPNGMSLSAGGVLSGIPSESGTFPLTIRAQYADNCAVQRTYSLYISYTCPSVYTVQVTVPAGRAGDPYTYTLNGQGGTGPYTFTAVPGGLPQGITLSSSGLLSGTTTSTGSFPFVVSVMDANGCQGARNLTLTITPFGNLQFFPLGRPIRLLDTRAGQGNCDSVSIPITGGTNILVQASGFFCDGQFIPSNAQAIVGNITAINATSQSGYLTLYPNGVSQPTSANMIYAPNQILTNAFTVGLSSVGEFKIFAERNIDAVVDITGYYAPPTTGGLYFHSLSTPARLLDTRAGQGNCDNVSSPINGGTNLLVQGRGMCEGLTIPGGAQAITGNVTVINSNASAGYMTLYPNGVSQPVAANMVYSPGQILANGFIVSLSENGQFNVFAERTIEVVIDVSGYFSTDAIDANGTGLLFTPLRVPARLLDTRAGFGNCDNVSVPIQSGTSISVSGRTTCEGQLIPQNSQALVGNLTVINGTSQSGYLTLFPHGVTAPLAANIIYASGQIISNAFIVGFSTSGDFDVFAERTIDVVLDIGGYFAP